MISLQQISYRHFLFPLCLVFAIQLCISSQKEGFLVDLKKLLWHTYLNRSLPMF